MAAQVTYNPIVQESVDVVQTLAMQIMVNLFLEGVQLALGFAALSALAHAGGKKFTLYFAVILVILALFVNTVMNLLFNVMQIPGVLAANYPDPQGLANRLTRMKIAADVLRKVILFVSDIIVIWRAWIMYPKSCVVKTLLVLCALCGLGGLLVHSVYYDDPTHDYPEAMSLLLPVCTLAMNGIATLLVSWRLWTYRRDIKMAFDHASGATRVETVLGLLVESSVVYCVLWGVLTFVIIRNDRFPNTVTSYEIIAASYHYFAGIYVTLVILVLELQKTFADSLDVSTMVSRGISFAATPALPGHDTITDDSYDSYDSGTQPSATVRGSNVSSTGYKGKGPARHYMPNGSDVLELRPRRSMDGSVSGQPADVYAGMEDLGMSSNVSR